MLRRINNSRHTHVRQFYCQQGSVQKCYHFTSNCYEFLLITDHLQKKEHVIKHHS